MQAGPQGSATVMGASVSTDSSADRGPRGLFLAGAPISWGVCEVPGWGPPLPPDLVLSQMHELGLAGTELGPTGYLGDDPEGVRAAVSAHGLNVAGGFLPLVLWSPDPDVGAQSLAEADRAAATLAGATAGGNDTAPVPGPVLNVALVEDMDWSAPHELTSDEWAQAARHLAQVRAICAGYGVGLALHPHFDTLLEHDDQIQRALAEFTGIGWCLDTGHLTIAGTDPASFARAHAAQVTHVHLKDVDANLARQLAARQLTLLEATQMGVFRPLGAGDVDVAGTLAALRACGYDGWLVLEQDTSLTGDEPPESVVGPMRDVESSLGFIKSTAQLTGEEKV